MKFTEQKPNREENYKEEQKPNDSLSWPLFPVGFPLYANVDISKFSDPYFW